MVEAREAVGAMVEAREAVGGRRELVKVFEQNKLCFQCW